MARKSKKMPKGVKSTGHPRSTDKTPGGKKAPAPKNKPMPGKAAAKAKDKMPARPKKSKLAGVTF